jgi:ubiquinone/menaquinone biosynthesis C-methylase UbiE
MTTGDRQDEPGDTGQEPAKVREAVRDRYAEAATRFAAARNGAPGALAASCCGPDPLSITDRSGHEVFGAGLYEDEQRSEPAVAASLGCGVPTAVAELKPGDIVLDLGSGAGADVLIAARAVAPTGRVIGLDMTSEMVELARKNVAEAGVGNVEVIEGYLEDIPLPDASVDVVISNCVINLVGDKRRVLGEAARVLRPGGRFAVSDVVADPGMDDKTRADIAQWTGCIAGALTADEYHAALSQAGLSEIAITETHRVHPQAGSAIIRAYKPPGPSTP